MPLGRMNEEAHPVIIAAHGGEEFATCMAKHISDCKVVSSIHKKHETGDPFSAKQPRELQKIEGHENIVLTVINTSDSKLRYGTAETGFVSDEFPGIPQIVIAPYISTRSDKSEVYHPETGELLEKEIRYARENLESIFKCFRGISGGVTCDTHAPKLIEEMPITHKNRVNYDDYIPFENIINLEISDIFLDRVLDIIEEKKCAEGTFALVAPDGTSAKVVKDFARKVASYMNRKGMKNDYKVIVVFANKVREGKERTSKIIDVLYTSIGSDGKEHSIDADCLKNITTAISLDDILASGGSKINVFRYAIKEKIFTASLKNILFVPSHLQGQIDLPEKIKDKVLQFIYDTNELKNFNINPIEIEAANTLYGLPSNYGKKIRQEKGTDLAYYLTVHDISKHFVEAYRNIWNNLPIMNVKHA